MRRSRNVVRSLNKKKEARNILSIKGTVTSKSGKIFASKEIIFQCEFCEAPGGGGSTL